MMLGLYLQYGSVGGLPTNAGTAFQEAGSAFDPTFSKVLLLIEHES